MTEEQNEILINSLALEVAQGTSLENIKRRLACRTDGAELVEKLARRINRKRREVMTPKQFKLLAEARFPRVDQTTLDACREVIIEGRTAYAAEKANGCKRGTVSRYVNKIHAELAFCEEVLRHE